MLSIHSSLLEGYNFSYQGILGIWEGFRPSRPQITAPHPTPRLPQRSLLLPDTTQNALSGLFSEVRSRSRQTSDKLRKGQNTTDSGGPSEEFSNAVATLLAENDPERTTTWRPAVPTNKPAQRRLALDLCGWSLAEEDLAAAVKKWEREHR